MSHNKAYDLLFTTMIIVISYIPYEIEQDADQKMNN